MSAALFASAGIELAERAVVHHDQGGRPGWRRLSPAGNKVVAHWRHEASGWDIRHCGHPTANWPYHLDSPSRPEIVMSHNGRGFRTLELGQEVAEGIAAGIYEATDDRCVPGVLRVIDTGKPDDVPSYCFGRGKR